ncbi:MAG TPA: hypothetical protein VFU86_09385 [Terriglobales bacterium]|nr:hypothetical protein [Terriglobales bacterium]
MALKNTKALLVRIGVVLLIVWLGFVGLLAYEMHRPPEQFGQFMKHMPVATFMIAPFETLWLQARAGQLQPGEMAPDFRLTTLDKSSEVELSSFREKSPVVLVFGSYT